MFKEPKNIHEAIVNVMGEVGYVQKQSKKGINYSYAGEAALISTIRPELVKYGITVHVASISDCSREQYTSKKGTVMTNTVLLGHVRFTHALSGTFIDVFSRGEASNSGDKSVYAAQTGMYKYALRQTFVIETGDDPDNFSNEQIERTTKETQSKIKNDKKAWIDAANTAGLMTNVKDAVQLAAFKIVLGNTLEKAGKNKALQEGLEKINAWHEAQNK